MTDTIREVLKTLGEAFVLVIVVVFLFLGNLRATLIPTIAVPVSLIGAFAGLLALGYSANTVSLLALVLAIGIVVDDAIVVVENVERVMEEDRSSRPQTPRRKAMEQITAPIIAITLVLLSVFVPLAFIPGISGQLFRQFAVTISVSVLISALNALTLSPALCAVFLRHSGPKRGIMALGDARHRQRARRLRLCGRARRLAAVSILWALVLAGCAFGGGSTGWPADHAHRVPAGGRPGRLLRGHSAAGRRLGRAHQQRGAPGGGISPSRPARRARHVRHHRIFAAGQRSGDPTPRSCSSS